jgi:hypothetical protein
MPKYCALILGLSLRLCVKSVQLSVWIPTLVATVQNNPSAQG